MPAGYGVINLKEIICSCAYYFGVWEIKFKSERSQITLKTLYMFWETSMKSLIGTLTLLAPWGCHSELLRRGKLLNALIGR
jgi:hypothetical protein